MQDDLFKGPGGPGNPELDSYIRNRLKQRLAELKSDVSPEYFEQAVKKYSSQGSVLRQQFFKEKADQAAQEAKHAQLGGTGGDMLERGFRDAASGAVRGFTSPGRFVAHHFLGIDPEHQTEQTLSDWSGEGMGGRGLSSNPVLGSIQSAVEPAAEMYGAAPLANKAVEGVGGALARGSKMLPKSGILQALNGAEEALPATASIGQRAAAVGRRLPSSMVKGTAAGTLSMPEETYEGGPMGLAQMGALSAVDALAAAKVPGARPSVGIRGAFRKVNEFFTPEEPTSKPLVDPAITQPVEEAAKPTSVEKGSDVVDPGTAGATKKPYTGGEPLDWSALDPTQGQQARDAFGKVAGNPQAIAELLGDRVKDHLGMTGKSPHVPTVENLASAKTPEDLHGWLQKALVRAASGAPPKMTNKVTPRKGKGVRIEMQERPDAIREMAQEAVQGSQPVQLEGEPIAPAAASTVSPRKGTLKRAEMPRTSEGMIDWDNLSEEQQRAVAKSFGKDYREAVIGMPLENIQKKLAGNQFLTVVKALTKPPKTGEAAPAVAGAETVPTAEVPAAEPVKVELGGVTARKGKMTPVTPDAEIRNQQAGVVPGEVIGKAVPIEPAAPTVDLKKVSPGWWDSEHATPEQKSALAKAAADRRQMPGDPALWAKTPFDQLPPFLRKDLTQFDAPALPEGGAAKKAASFRRKTGQKQSQSRGTL